MARSESRAVGGRPERSELAAHPQWIREATGPSEEEIHREHRAALEATLFRGAGPHDELILELDRGLLYVRCSDL